MQVQMASNVVDCYMGDYRTLSELRKMWGVNAPSVWLAPHLHNLMEFCGVKDKMDTNTIRELASIIATEFYYLKISELMLFFFRFKSGKYGRFYGAVDPLVITTSLRKYISERYATLHQLESIISIRKSEEMKSKAVTYDEYVRLYKGNMDKLKDSAHGE